MTRPLLSVRATGAAAAKRSMSKRRSKMSSGRPAARSRCQSARIERLGRRLGGERAVAEQAVEEPALRVRVARQEATLFVVVEQFRGAVLACFVALHEKEHVVAPLAVGQGRLGFHCSSCGRRGLGLGPRPRLNASARRQLAGRRTAAPWVTSTGWRGYTTVGGLGRRPRRRSSSWPPRPQRARGTVDRAIRRKLVFNPDRIAERGRACEKQLRPLPYTGLSYVSCGRSEQLRYGVSGHRHRLHQPQGRAGRRG